MREDLSAQQREGCALEGLRVNVEEPIFLFGEWNEYVDIRFMIQNLNLQSSGTYI